MLLEGATLRPEVRRSYRCFDERGGIFRGSPDIINVATLAALERERRRAPIQLSDTNLAMSNKTRENFTEGLTGLLELDKELQMVTESDDKEFETV